jgi:enoyl-CoA hydratase/carnithine racemase
MGPKFDRLKVTHVAGGRVALLELDHGKANEIGIAELAELERLTGVLETGDAAALVSFSRRRTARGTPIFVSGANVTERVGWDEARVKGHVRWQRAVLARLRAAPVLHVCVVNGVALGWGTEFLLSADYRIAAPQANFGLPETGLGIVPGAGGTSELQLQIGAPQALRLGLTGERIDAGEALRIGLVQEIADDVDAGLARAMGLAELAARRSPTALAAFKAGVLASAGLGPEARRDVEARAYDLCVDSGEAAIGRAHFDEIRGGATPPWGPRRRAG